MSSFEVGALRAANETFGMSALHCTDGDVAGPAKKERDFRPALLSTVYLGKIFLEAQLSGTRKRNQKRVSSPP